MRSIPGVLHKARESHVPVFAKRGILQDRGHNIKTDPSGVILRQQAEALYWAWVGFWGPVRRDPALNGSAAAAADSSRAQDEATIGLAVGRSGFRLLDAHSRCRPLGVASE